MPKLTREHITQGAFIWYGGTTSTSGWNCPAVITRVDEEARVFYVKSLDDMVEQSQPYAFDVAHDAPESRKSMRPATLEEVGAYLDRQEEALIEKVCMGRRVCRESSTTLRRFQREREQLFPDRLKK